MNWEAIGAMGEILGAAAVVLTLFYLARQLRDQNRASEIDAYEGIMNEFNEMNRMIASDKTLYRIFIDGLNRPDELDDDQAGQFSFLFRCYANNFQKVHRAYERGAISEREWGYLASQYAAMMESPGGKIFVEGHQDVFPEFVDEVRRHQSDSVVLDVSLCRERIL